MCIENTNKKGTMESKIQFSIIVPYYNVEAYIGRCILSLLKQNEKNIELIFVDDGSIDGSRKVVEEYLSKDNRISLYIKENGGLSDARNFGVTKASGDYILFVDSDDFVAENLLSEIKKHIDEIDKPDIIKFGYRVVTEPGLVVEEFPGQSFKVKSGQEFLLNYLKMNVICEMAWLYAYRREFFIENHFMYPIGKYHEDFGLTYQILLEAKTSISIKLNGYNYVVRSNSIMTNVESSKLRKRMNDIIFLYENNMKLTKHIELPTLQMYFESYLANVLINSFQRLPLELKKEFKTKLLNIDPFQFMIHNNLIRRIKILYLRKRFQSI